MDDPISVTLATTAATTAVSSFISNVVNEICGLVKKKATKTIEDKKFDEKLYDRLSDYYFDMTDNLSYVKTFLTENTLSFTEIYYPLSVSRYSSFIKYNSDGEIKVDENIENLFARNRRVIILGSAGSGKTMITKRIFLSALKHLNLIPIFIELRRIVSNKTIYDYIKTDILNFDTNKEEEEVFYNILKTGKFLFILDGFDEIEIDNQNRNFRINDIENFTSQFSKNSYLITSRFYNKAERLQHFDTYVVCGIKKDNLIPFIVQQCKFIYGGQKYVPDLISYIKIFINETDINSLLHFVNPLGEINYSDYNYIFDYCSNPLLLTLIIKTFIHRLYVSHPINKSQFIKDFYSGLWSAHDIMSKGKYYRHIKYYDEKTHETILKYFCYSTLINNQSIFYREDLQTWLDNNIGVLHLECEAIYVIHDWLSQISIFTQNGGKYTFLHKSFQDYFAALYISSLHQDFKKNEYNRIKDPDNLLKYENLLAFLCEIDHFSFIEYYLQPNIKELLITLENISLVDYLKELIAKKSNNKYQEFWFLTALIYFYFRNPSERDKNIEDLYYFKKNCFNKRISGKVTKIEKQIVSIINESSKRLEVIIGRIKNRIDFATLVSL